MAEIKPSEIWKFFGVVLLISAIGMAAFLLAYLTY